jgi:hypothetical protein
MRIIASAAGAAAGLPVDLSFDEVTKLRQVGPRRCNEVSEEGVDRCYFHSKVTTD